MKPQIKKPSDNTATKFLERKSVIRLFGLGLFLAPIINAAIVIWLKKVQVIRPLSLPVIAHLFASGTFTQKFLTLSSIAIGLIMLYGSTKAWKFVLGLLGCHILIQISNLGHDLRENWLWGPFFLVNVSIFFFIADQLVFKLKVAPAKPAAPPNVQPAVHTSEQQTKKSLVQESTPPAAREIIVKSKILIHFDQLGPWGQLKTVSIQGLRVQCLQAGPIEIEQRELELQFKNGLYIKSRFKFRAGQEFYFEFMPTSISNQKLLQEWIARQSA